MTEINKFSKIKKYSKSSLDLNKKMESLDLELKKTKVLSEGPANNTSSIYIVEPESSRDVYITTQETESILNFSQDDYPQDVTGIFDQYGNSLVEDPPGNWAPKQYYDNGPPGSEDDFGLGPMASYYDSGSNTTYFGYVRSLDRSMINLGRITGTIESWNGSSNFVSYGYLTLEQVQWFKSKVTSNNTTNYRVFYNGITDPSDAHGRINAILISTPKSNVSVNKMAAATNTNPFPSTTPINISFYRMDYGVSVADRRVVFYDSDISDAPTDDPYLGPPLDSYTFTVPGSGLLRALRAASPSSFMIGGVGLKWTYPPGEPDGDLTGSYPEDYLNFYIVINGREYPLPGLGGVMAAIGIPGYSNGWNNPPVNSKDGKPPGPVTRQTSERIPPKTGGWDPNIVPGSALPKDGKKPKPGDKDYPAYKAGGGDAAVKSGKTTQEVIDQGRKNLEKNAQSSGSYPPDKVPGENLPTRGSSKPKTNKGLEIVTKWHGTSKSAAGQIKQGGFNTTKTGLIPNRVWVGDKNVAGGYAQGGRSSGSMGKNAPDDRTLIPVRTPRGAGTTFPDWGGTQTALPKDVADRGAGNKNVEKRRGRRPNPGTRVRTPGMSGSVSATGTPSGSGTYTPGGGGRFGISGIGLADEYANVGQTISESTKKIIKNIKKPYVLPEQPKVKYKVKPGANRTINADLMKQAEVPSSFKQAEERMWGKHEKMRNSRMSQERKNQVLDYIGTSDHAWEWMTEKIKTDSKKIMYGNFDIKKYMGIESDKVKGKIVNIEQTDNGDALFYFQDEFGKKSVLLQSEFDELLNENQTREKQDDYTDNLYRKSLKKLGYKFDYSEKPSKKGYPNVPPPEMVNGYHPEYGENDPYYNKLDPQSAAAMPKTGNPHIDKKVKAARKKPK